MTWAPVKLRNAVISLIVIATIAGLVPLNKAVQTLNRRPVLAEDQILNYRWNSDFFKIVTFGHTPAAVDILLIRFLADDSLTHVQSGKHARIFYDLDLASELDPLFLELHRAGASLLTVARNDHLGALTLLNRADSFRLGKLLTLPKPFQDEDWALGWRIPFLKGYVYLFELNDLPRATEAYRELEGIKGVPAGLHAFLNRFTTSGGPYEVGMRILKNMIAVEKSEPVREELEKKRNSLYISQYLFQLNEAFEGSLPGKTATKLREKRYLTFIREHHVPPVDPWGGRFFLNSEGKIDSTTPRSKVLGL